MKKKIIQTVVLLLLLVIFPILSWLFLKDGLQYRLDAKTRLVVKANLPENSTACLPGKIQVLYEDKEGSWRNRLKPLSDHFADREEILLFRAVDSLAIGSTRDSLQKSWIKSSHTGGFHDAIFLVDTTCSLRMTYDMTQDKDMAALAEDITFLLPLEEEKDYLLKREREK